MKRTLCTMAVALFGAQLLVGQPAEQEFRLPDLQNDGSEIPELALNEPRPRTHQPPKALQAPQQPPRGPQPPQGGPPGMPPGVPAGFGGGGGGPGIMPPPFEEHAKRTLFITTAKMESATRDALREDLNIMSRILDKAVERSMESGAQERRMGIQLMALPGARGENIYVGDYGVIFVLNVPMSLAAPGKSGDEKSQEAESDWEQTKRELYSHRGFGSPFGPMKYDAKKVEVLKNELVEALKNASNIRNLKPDQTVTIVVSGAETGGVFIGRRIVQSKPGGKERDEKQEEVFHAKLPEPQHSTLTIHARKSDIDAFAGGKMKLEDFAKKAAVVTY